MFFSHIPSFIHALFEYLAIFFGVQYYRLLRLKLGGGGILKGPNFALVIGSIIGAGIGNKVVYLIEYPSLIFLKGFDINVLFSGQSIVGGLLGGLIGVEISKKLNEIEISTGDDFVYPILLGIMIGRIGCFLAGLSDGTFGNATSLPWGVDFGDGVLRHPTQLYDLFFVLTLWCLLKRYESKLNFCPGLRLKCMLSSYLFWRLVVDFLKPIPFTYFYFLSGIQVVCIVSLIFYLPMTVKSFRKATL